MCIMCLLTLFWTFEQGRGVIWFFLLGESSYSWKLLLPFLWEVVGIPIIQWNKEERWCFQAMETQVIITFVNLKKEKKTPQNFLVLFKIFKTWEYRTTSIYGSKQGRFFFFPGEKQPETPEITKSFKEKKLLSLSRTRKLVIRKLLGPQRKTRRNAIHQSSHRHNQLRMLNMNFQKLLSIYSMDRDTSSQMILYT